MRLLFDCISARWRLAAVVVGCALAFATGEVRAAYTVERVVGGLNQPMGVTQAPGDNTSLYIVERSDPGNQLGRIRNYNLQTQSFTTFLDVPGSITADGGLLSMTFHPEYQSNGLFYTVTNVDGTNGLDEYKVLGGTPQLQRRLLEYQNLNNVFHTLNQAHFRPNGNNNELFVTAGDGGTQADDPDFDIPLIEGLNSPYGKLMKFDLTANFATPADGPSHPGIEVVAAGLRNPYRSSFDRDTGDFYVGDVGFVKAEEISFIPASHFTNPTPTVLNYGWTDREGTVETDAPFAGGPGSAGDIEPIFDYPHPGKELEHEAQFSGASVTGGYVYRGPVAELQGRYFLSDFINGNVYSGEFDTSTSPSEYDGTNLSDIQDHTIAFENLVGDGANIRSLTSFGEDNAGNLYLVKFGNGFFPPLGQGEIFRIVPALSETIEAEIDRETGAITLSNISGETISFTSLTISSSFGAIASESLTPITGNYDLSGNGDIDSNDDWTISSPTGSRIIFTEATTGDAGALDAGQQITFSPGGGWIRSPTEDLFVNLLSENGAILNATVNFTGNGGDPFSRSDVNFDGEIDISDWSEFLLHADTDLSGLSLAEAYAQGDLNADGISDYVDFMIFKNDFNSVNGGGAFEAMLTAVPEPSSLLMAAGGFAMLFGGTRRLGGRRRGWPWPIRLVDALTMVLQVFRLQPTSCILGGRLMSRDGCFDRTRLSRVAFAAVAVAVVGLPANAALVNKYTFNDNTANDSVGGQNGVVVDNTGISQYTGGAIDLRGNNNLNSNQDFTQPATAGAYVDLPNGVFTSAVNGGTFGAVTLEAWTTVETNRNWARLADFGTSDLGENNSEGAPNSNYVFIAPQAAPDGNQVFAGSTHSGSGDSFAISQDVVSGGPGPLPTGIKHHIVFVMDHNDTAGGVNPNGTATLYLNNGAPVTAPIADGLLLDQVSDVNNWLGRAQWGDPLFDGTIDEFRIYDHTLSAGEVANSFTTGPDPSALPTLVVDRGTGAISITNESPGNIQLKGYSITSAAGGLDPATWTSIDADNVFDPNGTWTSQSSSNAELTESVTGGTLDGGSLGEGASRGVGTPWVPTPFEDLMFSFTLGDDTTGLGTVQFTGDAIQRSDLNGDGDINEADWALFLPHGFTDLTEETDVGAYLKGDLNGDKLNNLADYRIFKNDFIAANGVAAFAALEGSNVPEPTTIALFGVAMFAALLGRKSSRAVRI